MTTEKNKLCKITFPSGNLYLGAEPEHGEFILLGILHESEPATSCVNFPSERITKTDSYFTVEYIKSEEELGSILLEVL